MIPKVYQSKNQIRILCTTSLYDGHDAAINIMRRIFQSSGCEVIYLGHNRSAEEIANAAIQENVQGIAITSYQGGHMEFFKYVYDLTKVQDPSIKIIGGGGGTILPSEIKELEAYGISKIYAPEDGQKMGLQGMINDVMSRLDFKKPPSPKNHTKTKSFTLGVTGTGGAGKSSLIDELILRLTTNNPDLTIGLICVDPTKRISGGALLGDRIRMNALDSPNTWMTSIASKGASDGLSTELPDLLTHFQSQYDLVIIESSGIGQSGSNISDISDLSLYVMTAEYGAATQLEKIDMIDFADIIAINKFGKAGSQDAFKDVCKQFKRSRQAFQLDNKELPIFGTVASQFNDVGINALYNHLVSKIEDIKLIPTTEPFAQTSSKPNLLPQEAKGYLSDIAKLNRAYGQHVEEEALKADRAQSLFSTLNEKLSVDTIRELQSLYEKTHSELSDESKSIIEKWPALKKKYAAESYEYKVRERNIEQPLHTESLSGNLIPKVSLPNYHSWGDIIRWRHQENMPGRFPFAAGVFPMKRKGEAPTRMFAGEGDAERTNERFHFLSKAQPTARLSTAFDSVTLYGEDPDIRPDIYGKVGNSGVSVACLSHAKKLYSGFDLNAATTSVSMTINGPAPIILAMFLNTAIDQACEKELKVAPASTDSFRGNWSTSHDGLGLGLLDENASDVIDPARYETIKTEVLNSVRGTVQADILKEDQAQNTCIFSTEFALKMMGDIQEYFVEREVKNFYSVSVSGYHIAEAGANPITQLAFTLANGFTYVEYYLSRGLNIDDFAPNLSFFFSNGLDPEYAVIGRVARKIWAKALKHKYNASEASQKLKYHIQTSGRSLHAQEVQFNDIRTTLQALYAIYDNCNSLHTNAYDEAITTPTEESVRRALAIQLIIDKELGLNNNENPLQGSFIIEELTDLVEEAVLIEFDRLSERDDVLGAMERMYQRHKIQEESMYYEGLKHSGKIPIIGVNTFVGEPSPNTEQNVTRASETEKMNSINTLKLFKERNLKDAPLALAKLKEVALSNQNIFAELMNTVKYCSLGEITGALYEVGGKYRRNS